MRTIAGRALRASAFFAGFLVSTAALAHAHLQQQTPAADSTVTASPESLTLSFSEGIETAFSAVTLTGPQQKAVVTGKLARSDSNKAQLIVPLTQPLSAGEYTVDWHVVSVDGHKTKGQYHFSVK
ncbi:CopC domain-containing protein YobA [Raoultella planticola]|uniref:CopC domain-containing protein YobA n=1 Tax=Raoultella planticola TaxID=575 RepID=UPI001034CC65|nr:CopC domain-containing protein YobA [Raoultella planticola]